MGATWDDYLSWAGDYRVRLEEALPTDDGRVFVSLALSYRAKAGGGVVNGPLYSLIEVEDGLITRIDEYTERADALEAAGLPE
jgi:ketosteroid isomerase-like protein